VCGKEQERISSVIASFIPKLERCPSMEKKVARSLIWWGGKPFFRAHLYVKMCRVVFLTRRSLFRNANSVV